jgi:formylglycine-generating enzyme required for sulfatase activity
MAGVRSLSLAMVSVLVLALLDAGERQPIVLDLVKVDGGLQVMRHEVTIAQWRQCVADGDCSHEPPPGPGAADDGYPVTGVGALDVAAFAAWAGRKSGKSLRLPTLEEWYGFSNVTPVRPVKIFTDPRLAWAAAYGVEGKMDPRLRRPSGFGSNSRGIADVKGNVWEWTSSCVVKVRGSLDHCPAYFVAGEHEAKVPVFVRDPAAGGCATGTPPAHLGFRLVLDAAAR